MRFRKWLAKLIYNWHKHEHLQPPIIVEKRKVRRFTASVDHHPKDFWDGVRYELMDILGSGLYRVLELETFEPDNYKDGDKVTTVGTIYVAIKED